MHDIIEDPGPRRRAQIAEAQALNTYGVALKEQRNYPAAIVAFERAKALLPDDALIRANLSTAMLSAQRYLTAMDEASAARRLDPGCLIAWQNTGIIATALNLPAVAENAFAVAETIAPGDPKTSFDRSQLRLSQGDWALGLEDYESRLLFKEAKMYGRFPVPHWDGSSLDGKSIFVQFEQGIGDRILMSRYLAELWRRWPEARIVTCINRDLLPLFWPYREYGVEFLHDGIPWPDDIDCAVYAGSLLRLLGVRRDNIVEDPGVMREAAGAHHKRSPFNLPKPNAGNPLRVGIAWTGNPAQLRNDDRSVPLIELATLAQNPNVILYSLQVGPAGADVARLGLDQIICDITPDLAANGFMATATAMLQLDVVVSVCTATAHLAGVLGVPCLMMTALDPYWIWGRSDSWTPFYPSLTLFRQHRAGHWGDVLSSIRVRLAVMARNKV